MKVYTLTKTDTQQSFSPIKVNTFLTMVQAKKAMFNDVTTDCGNQIFEEGLYNGLDGEVVVACDYARYQFTLWEIFETEISDKELIINNFINDSHEVLAFPSIYDAVIHDMLNEYNNETLRDKSFNDLYGNIFVGECLYQHALENLGGKPDEKSTSIIFDYLDYKFSEKECAKYVTELDFLENKWLVGMLMLCKGNKDIINDVRQSIDNSQPIDGKIFEKELSENKVKKIVTFEVTTEVMVDRNEMPEIEDEDAINKAICKMNVNDISNFIVNDETFVEDTKPQISLTLECDLNTLKYRLIDILFFNIAARILFDHLEEVEQYDDLFEILTECVEVYNNEIEVDETLPQRLKEVLNRYI